jgi:hypothetical protein
LGLQEAKKMAIEIENSIKDDSQVGRFTELINIFIDSLQFEISHLKENKQ